MSARWTFTPAIVASVHCPCAALRHPGFACFRSPLAGTGTPSLIKCGATQEAGSGSDQTGSTADAASAATAASRLPPAASSECTARPTRRQDAANELQQNVTNLGFVAFCPKESRARCPSFP